MACGGTNAARLSDVNQRLIAMYQLGWNTSAASKSPTTKWSAYHRDYISSYSNSENTGTFTVKVPCTLKFYMYGKGSIKGSSSGSGFPVSVTIAKNSGGTTTNIIVGTISSGGGYSYTTGSNGTNVTFENGDTFSMTATYSNTGSRAGIDAGMMVQLVV